MDINKHTYLVPYFIHLNYFAVYTIPFVWKICYLSSTLYRVIRHKVL